MNLGLIWGEFIEPISCSVSLYFPCNFLRSCHDFFFKFHLRFCNHPCFHIGVETDRIRTDTNSNVTVYHILVRIRIRIQISSDTNTKQIVESEFLFGYLLNSTQIAYPKI
jgi:hypothetical protein